MNPRLLAAIIAIIGALTVSVVITSDDGPDGKHTSTTITLGGIGHKQVAIPPAADQIAKTQEAQDRAGDETAAEADLHGEKPLTDAQEHRLAAKTPPGQVKIPLHLPLASASVPGCRSYPVRNSSSRGGAPVLLGVTHWTASKDTFPSWSGILGNVKWFDQPASQASSSEIMDSGGQCALTVPEALKPWTQTNYNRVSVSVEVTNPGTHPIVRAAGLKALARLYVGWHDRWNLPLQRASVYNGPATSKACPTVYKPGILEHVDLGLCGGGHPDVGHDPQVDQAIALARQIVAARAEPTPAQQAVRSHKILHAKIRAHCHTSPRPRGCTLYYDRLGKLHAKYRNLPR